MRLDYVERRFSRLFSSYIKVVVACPLPFIILPSILTAFLSIGLGSHSKAFIKDDLKLYTVSTLFSSLSFKILMFSILAY